MQLPRATLLTAIASLGAGGAAWTWLRAAREGFGGATDAEVTFGVLAAAAFALGATAPLRRVGLALAGLGISTAAAWLLAPAAPAVLASLGAGLSAGPWALGSARLAVGAVLLGPAAFLAGGTLRAAAHALPECPGRGLFGLTVAGAGGGALLAILLSGPVSGEWIAAGSALLLVASGAVAWRIAPAASPEVGEEDVASLLPTGAAAFAATTFAFLTHRAFVPVFGDALPGIPVAGTLFLGGFLAGALIALALRARPRFPAGTEPALVSLLLAQAAVLFGLYPSLEHLPTRFTEAVGAAESLQDLLREGALLAAPHVAAVGAGIGAAAAFLAAAAPADPRARPPWVAGAGRAAAAGAVLGLLLPRVLLHPAGLAGTMVAAFGLTVAGISASLVLGSRNRRAGRAAVAVVLAAAAFAAVKGVDPPDRDGLLVERDYRSPRVPVSAAMDAWVTFDEDGVEDTYTILKRGHTRRLLVNGRLSLGTVTELKSHGLLAHLPLVMHGAAARVCVMGGGNGRSLRAALAHPIEGLDLLVTEPAEARALAAYGAVAERALEDARVRVRAGDLRDLLRRSEGYDVILSHASGGWTERSARASTREFLELVRDRLRNGGMYAHWTPGSALTKEGFLVLAGTLAAVFPDVEAWAGQGGDVVFLARTERAPHDFSRILDAYSTRGVAPALNESWLGDPVTLLSQFLLPDEAVRGLTRSRPVHTGVELAAGEADRRLREPTVNPVPGLAEVRGQTLPRLENAPGSGLDAALVRAYAARDLERRGEDAEAGGRTRIEGLQAAAEVYDRALELNPRDGAVRRALARAHSQIGVEYAGDTSFTAAYSHMLRAVEVDSTYAQGFGNLGFLLLQNEDFDYADVVTRQAIALAPDDDLFHYQRARIWKTRGYLDDALPMYEKALEINPQNVDIALGYSDLLLALDRNPNVEWNLRFLEPYEERHPDNEYLTWRVDMVRDLLERGIEVVRREQEDLREEEDVPLLLQEVEESGSAPDGARGEG